MAKTSVPSIDSPTRYVMNEQEKKTLKKRFILWANRQKLDIRFQKKGFLFRVILHERFKPIVRGIKVTLTIISLLSAFFVFKSVLIAFIFGLAIFLAISFLEKTIYSYNSLYVCSIPDFKIKPDKWLGVAFGFAEDPKNHVQIPAVSWIMSDFEYAKQVHSVLKRWSNEMQQDEENNICTSVIVEGKDQYTFFCYPNIDRKTAKIFFEDGVTKRKGQSLTDVHHKMMLTLIFGKSCPIGPNSNFTTFRKRYQSGSPYIFRLAVLGKDGNIFEVDGIEDFVLFNLKIKDIEQLNRKDIEFDLVRVLK